MKTLLTLILFSSTWAPAWGADEKPPARPDLSWLAGSWRAELWGGVVEEMYSPQNEAGVFGSFRFSKGGKVELYEMFVIEHHREGTILRLKHFHFGLKGWEEKNDYIENKLVESAPGSLVFFGMVGIKKMWQKFRFVDRDSFEIRLIRETPDKDAPERADLVKKSEEVFRYQRIRSVLTN